MQKLSSPTGLSARRPPVGWAGVMLRLLVVTELFERDGHLPSRRARPQESAGLVPRLDAAAGVKRGDVLRADGGADPHGLAELASPDVCREEARDRTIARPGANGKKAPPGKPMGRGAR